MSETKTEYVVQFRRSKELNWQSCKPIKDKAEAERKYENDASEFHQLKHRLIRVTVLKETK